MAGLGVRITTVMSLGVILYCTGCTENATTSVKAVPLAPVAEQSDKGQPRNLKLNPMGDPGGPDTIHYSSDLTSQPAVVPSSGVAVSQEAALKIAALNGFGEDLQPASPRVDLRMVTQGEASLESQTARLAWVVTWTNSKPDIRGPATLSQSDREQLASQTQCIFIFIVDAANSDSLDARQICVPK